MNHILKQNGIDPEKDVTVEFKSEATEVAAMLEGAENAVAVLPQPYVTVAMTKNDKIRIALDLTEEWEKTDGSSLVTGVTVVQKEFLEAHPETVEKFLEEYAASVEYVNTDNDGAAALVGKYDIVAEGVAKKALPYCNIVSLTGEDMKLSIEKYLEVLFNSDPKSVGGQLPDEAFYYIKKLFQKAQNAHFKNSSHSLLDSSLGGCGFTHWFGADNCHANQGGTGLY